MMMDEASENDDDVVIPAPATRDAKGRLLPGQRSINPRGRPAVIRDVKEAAKSHTRQAMLTLLSVMNDSDAPAAARVSAAQAVLDRGWGKPSQNIDAKLEVRDAGRIHAEVLMELSRKAREAKLEREANIIDVSPGAKVLN
jgi:hypothetical protein